MIVLVTNKQKKKLYLANAIFAQTIQSSHRNQILHKGNLRGIVKFSQNRLNGVEYVGSKFSLSRCFGHFLALEYQLQLYHAILHYITSELFRVA